MEGKRILGKGKGTSKSIKYEKGRVTHKYEGEWRGTVKKHS